MKWVKASAKPMDNFSFLDQQLVQLLLRICAEQGCKPDKAQRALLDQVVHQLGAATREGTIAVALSTFEPEIDVELLESLPVVGAPGNYAPLIIEDGHLWLNRYWQYEQRLANNLQARLQATSPLGAVPMHAIQHALSALRPDNADVTNKNMPQTDWQQQAIALATCSHFSIISGGPGTGKTTTNGIMRA